ncbi:MAG: hypothetical protein KW788_01470 [Candidatus Doudnabacteria bacterium]|nr:hypothetical protein [Candidatus Doudnabacteria bacterium]
MSVLKCVVPNCGSRFSPDQAFVPELAAIRKVVKRAISVAELTNHVLCSRHNHAAREQKIKTFRYLDTIKEIERRMETREKDAKFFSMYAAFEKVMPADPKSATRPG